MMKLYLTASFYNLATSEERTQKVYLTTKDLERVLMEPLEESYADESEILKKLKITKLTIRTRSTNG